MSFSCLTEVLPLSEYAYAFTGFLFVSLLDLVFLRRLFVNASLPAPLVNQRKVGQLKPKVEQGKVKAFAQKLVGPGYCRLAPKQEEAPIQKINLQVPIKKVTVLQTRSFLAS